MKECEELIKSVQQEGDLWLELAADMRVVTHQNEAYMWSMQEDEESGRPDHYKTKSTV